MGWELKRFLLNVEHQRMLVSIKVRCDTKDHLVDEDTNGPIVYHLVVATLFENFRGEVLTCATLCHGDLVSGEDFSESKVDNLDVAICIKHDVL